MIETKIKDQIVLIDDDDIDLLKIHWWITNGYVSGRIDGRFIYLHRLILEKKVGRSLSDNKIADHINGSITDNRKSNLRCANPSQSMMNRAKQTGKSSPYIGVVFFSNPAKRVKRWKAYIRVDGKQKTIGYFHTPEEAAKARDEAVKEFYGGFARLNNV